MQRLGEIAAEEWRRTGLLKSAGIPAPTGPMKVGCLDVMHRFPRQEDGLLVRLFYPTEPGLEGTYEYAKWFSHLKYVKSFARSLQMKESGELSAILEGKISACCAWDTLGEDVWVGVAGRYNTLSDTAPRTPALDSAPVASSGTTGGTLPLVVFSHGLSGMRTVYSGICCDLASHGFLVAVIEHRDESAGLCLRRVPVSSGFGGCEYQDDWILYRELKAGEKGFPLRQRQVRYH